MSKALYPGLGIPLIGSGNSVAQYDAPPLLITGANIIDPVEPRLLGGYDVRIVIDRR